MVLTSIVTVLGTLLGCALLLLLPGKVLAGLHSALPVRGVRFRGKRVEHKRAHSDRDIDYASLISLCQRARNCRKESTRG